MSNDPKKFVTALLMRSTAFKNDAAVVLLMAERLQQATILLDEWSRFGKGLKFDEPTTQDGGTVPAAAPSPAGTDRP